VRATFNHLGDLTLTRNLKVGSGNGIDFSASGNAAGMSSELLDDYEEGTWTPTVTTASSVNVNQAQYTKIGRSVTVSCYISWTNDQNNNTSTWNIGGLPFTGTLSNNFEAGSIGYTGAVQSDDFLLLKHANASILYMHKSSGGDSSTWDNAEITTRGLNVIIVTVTYQLPS
jgi:hypothetical protein